MRKWIKVCGMKYEQNIKELSLLDIDMMGMIFYDKSPRAISEVPQVKVPKNIKKVGVFVNSSYEYIMKSVKDFGLDKVQLHGSESLNLCKEIVSCDVSVIKAFGIDDDFDFELVAKYENVCSLFIFDAKTKKYGGSGRKFNWEKLEEYKGNVPFLLSGGISSNDVEDVLSFKHKMYAGIDLNSGFEIDFGIKDVKLIETFVKKYR